MRVGESAERAYKEAETASLAVGRASEAGGSALRHLGVPQRQLGGPWEGRGAETIMKMKATTGKKNPSLLNGGIIGQHPVQGHCLKIKAI